jgi:hypothetical protein
MWEAKLRRALEREAHTRDQLQQQVKELQARQEAVRVEKASAGGGGEGGGGAGETEIEMGGGEEEGDDDANSKQQEEHSARGLRVRGGRRARARALSAEDKGDEKEGKESKLEGK